MAIRKVIDTDADDGSVLDPPPADDDGDDAGDDGEVGVGAQPMPEREEPEKREAPRRGGRPKGSRNRTTVEREQASATGVGAPTSRPAGGAGQFPGEEGKIPIEADQLWMYVLEEIQKEGFSPYDMEIRVDRLQPLPAGPVTEFDAAGVMGDATTSPATALRKFVRDWIHLPSGVMGPGLYVLHFCWKNRAKFFRRGELKMPGRNECIAMKQSEEARQNQTGAAGFGDSMPQAPSPRAPMPPQQPPQQQQYSYGFGAPQPSQAPFDPEAERAKIRAEMDREYEMDRLRRENDELRRQPRYAPPQQPQYGPGFGNGYPPPQQRRGVGAPQQPQQQYEEDPDARTARVVMQVLIQSGVLPQHGAAPVGAGSPTVTQAVAAASGLGDDFERAMETVTRGKKVFKKMKEIFDEDDDETPKAKPVGAGAAAEGEEPQQQKVRFQGTGSHWRDGREVMMPIDEDGEPMLPTTMAAAMATGFANPTMLEPIVAGVGALLKGVSTMAQGLGGQPQQQPMQRADIGVQQVYQQPQQQPQQPPPQMPAPTPYTPAPAAATPNGGSDGWNLT